MREIKKGDLVKCVEDDNLTDVRKDDLGIVCTAQIYSLSGAAAGAPHVYWMRLKGKRYVWSRQLELVSKP